MTDFPITSMLNYAAAAICLIAATRMYFAAKEKKDNNNVRYFFYSFVFLSIYFFANGIPLFFFNGTFSITVITSVFRPFLLIAGMFLCLIPINLTRLRVFEKYYIYTLISITIISSALTLRGLISLNRIPIKGIGLEYWVRPENSFFLYGMILTGVFFALPVFVSSIYYFVFGMKNKGDKIVFGRSLMIGFGSLCLSLGAVLMYVYGVTADSFLFASTIASVLFMMGAVSFISSVNYKGEKKSIKK